MDEIRDEGLLRVIGPVGLTASLVNTVIGGGIFAIPAALALTVGSAGAFAMAGIGGSAPPPSEPAEQPDTAKVAG